MIDNPLHKGPWLRRVRY